MTKIVGQLTYRSPIKSAIDVVERMTPSAVAWPAEQDPRLQQLKSLYRMAKAHLESVESGIMIMQRSRAEIDRGLREVSEAIRIREIELGVDVEDQWEHA